MANFIQQILQSSAPVKIQIPTHLRFAAGGKNDITIAPRNAGLFLAQTPVKSIPEDQIRRWRAEPVKLPDTWSWVEDSSFDSPEQKNIKKGGYITPVGNQGVCGCCYGFSLAQAISDIFVISGKTKFNDRYYNPSISVTGVLQQGNGANTSDIPNVNGICNGGLAPILANYFVNKQVPLYTDHCMDFSWCDSNCSSESLPRFGCVDAGDKLGFTVKNFGSYVLDPYGKENKPGTILSIQSYPDPGPISPPDNPESADLIKYRETLKRHILEKGPVLGLFIVTNNFMTGDSRPFASTEDIFLEVNDYTNSTATFNREIRVPQDMEGGHAVSVVGWGLSEKEYEYARGKKARIPYWLVRNSWTTAWGDKGFFKMPMYPYNRVVQFDRQVPVSIGSGQAINIGGHYFVEADSILKEKYNTNGFQIPADRNSFFQKDVFSYDDVKNKPSPPTPTPQPPSPKKPDNGSKHKKPKISIWEWTTLILAIAVLIAVAFAVYMSLDNKKVIVQPTIVSDQIPVISRTKIFDIKTIKDLPPAVKPFSFRFF